MNFLILYATLEGQTAKIADRITNILRSNGHRVSSYPAEQIPVDANLDTFDAAILGGPIHVGHYPKSLKKFVRQHHAWLDNIPTAFFTVCMAINSKNEKSQREAAAYVDTFMKETNWQPTTIAIFAGAVKYTRYNFVTRFIMKMIAKNEGGSTDTSHDHEYTDWDAVTRFSEQFAMKLTTLQDA